MVEKWVTCMLKVLTRNELEGKKGVVYSKKKGFFQTNCEKDDIVQQELEYNEHGQVKKTKNTNIMNTNDETYTILKGALPRIRTQKRMKMINTCINKKRINSNVKTNKDKGILGLEFVLAFESVIAFEYVLALEFVLAFKLVWLYVNSIGDHSWEKLINVPAIPLVDNSSFVHVQDLDYLKENKKCGNCGRSSKKKLEYIVLKDYCQDHLKMKTKKKKKKYFLILKKFFTFFSRFSN
ncbi:hypothetical protein RFI_31626 [Reticulomyxa filosa]|uniref:Uncharacterized protein n=1 Tax=Reticulomyxa filosa TaxID=46433 RepID=X6LWN1_RETFI|nr:hypothetical protein RFI_31626 [Reticulomyxa filosa]|eukprot:ETO05771.1 hypothetical protein RFI_31626 [Reticulomyxa filosa]